MKKQTRENQIDYYYQEQCGQCNADKFYDEIEDLLNPDSSITQKANILRHCRPLLFAVKELLRLRIFDPASFDLLCIKAVFPEMTYDEIANLLKGVAPDLQLLPTRRVFRSRGRVSELVKTAIEKFPELAKIICSKV